MIRYCPRSLAQALGSGHDHSLNTVTALRRSLALLILPPATACATWTVLATVDGIIYALLRQRWTFEDGLRTLAGALLIVLLSALAFAFHLLFVLPITWRLRDQSIGLGSVLGRLIAPALGAAALFTAFFFDARADSVIDVLWIALVVVALPILLMTATAAKLQASFRPLPDER